MKTFVEQPDGSLKAYKARVDFTNRYRPNCEFKDYLYHVDESHAKKWIECVKANNPNIFDFKITLYN